MDSRETADRVAKCCEKIMETMNDADASRYVAIHALGAAACQVLAQIETEEAALELFNEMIEVVGRTMGMVSETRRVAKQTMRTAH